MSEKIENCDDRVLAAEEYVSRAREVMESTILSPDQRETVAIENIVKAFNLTPNPRYFINVFHYCVKKRITMVSVGMNESSIREILRDEDAKKYVLAFFAKKLDLIDQVRKKAPKERKTPQIYLPDLELLEILNTDSPSDRLSVMLYLYYEDIGDLKMAYENLLKAALNNPEECAKIFIEFCYRHKKFRELIVYFENTPHNFLDEDDKRDIALSYEDLFLDLSQDSTIIPENDEQSKMFLHLLSEGKNLYKENHDSAKVRLETDTDVAPDINDIIHVSNYGLSCLHVASHFDFMRKAGKTVSVDTKVLKNEGVEIFRYLIERIGEVRGKFDLYKSHLVEVKCSLVEALESPNMTSAELNEALILANQIKETNELYTLVKEKAVFLNNCANLLRNARKKDPGIDSIHTEEELLLESISLDWRNSVFYTALIEHYHERGSAEIVQKLRRDLVLSQFLKILIDFDKFQKPADFNANINIDHENEINFENIEEYDKSFKAYYEKRQKETIPIKDYFKPLTEALAPFEEKYYLWLKSICHERTEIRRRGKTHISTILKMLKEKKKFVSEITDLIGFRVLTPGGWPEAAELFSKIKESMREDRPMKPWIPENHPRGLRTMNITGYTKEDDIEIQVQIRPKNVDDEINSSIASHEFYKIESGKKLEDEIDSNPEFYIDLIGEILAGLSVAYNRFNSKTHDLNFHEIIKIYGETVPPEFGQIHQENNSGSGEPTSV